MVKGMDALSDAITNSSQREELLPRVNQLLVACTEVFTDIRDRLAKEDDVVGKMEYELIVKDCFKTMDGLLRSPTFGPRLTPKSITTFIKVILPLGRHGQRKEAIEILGGRSLLHNHLNRSHLLIVLIRECYSLVRKSRSSIVYLIKQLGKLVKLFEFQLKLRYESGVDPLTSKSSEFANINLDSLVYEVNVVLTECSKKRYPALYGKWYRWGFDFDSSNIFFILNLAESIDRLVEELETLLNLMRIYAELSGKCLLDNFILVKDAQNSKAFKYVKEQMDKDGQDGDQTAPLPPPVVPKHQNAPVTINSKETNQEDDANSDDDGELLDMIISEEPEFLNQEVINGLEELAIEDQLQEAQQEIEPDVQSQSSSKEDENSNDDWVLVDEPDIEAI